MNKRKREEQENEGGRWKDEEMERVEGREREMDTKRRERKSEMIRESYERMTKTFGGDSDLRFLHFSFLSSYCCILSHSYFPPHPCFPPLGLLFFSECSSSFFGGGVLAENSTT